ncbi:hypothetical protein NU195Hw_g2318t2 [Hortaea werneckii]
MFLADPRNRLLKNGSLTDLTVICGAYTHKVHKAILCAHSDYFAALPNFAEGLTNTIRLKAIGDDDDDEACDDPEAIKLMVHYFYYLDYAATIATKISPPSEAKSASRDAPSPKRRKVNRSSPKRASTATLVSISHDGNMVMHAKVFAAAVKYQVAALSKLAAKKFKDAVKLNWRHDSFAEAIRIVYSTTPEDVRALRDVVTLTLDLHDYTLLRLDGVMQVVKENKAVMFDLLCKGRRVGPFERDCASDKCLDCGAYLFDCLCSGCGDISE